MIHNQRFVNAGLTCTAVALVLTFGAPAASASPARYGMPAMIAPEPGLPVLQPREDPRDPGPGDCGAGRFSVRCVAPIHVPQQAMRAMADDMMPRPADGAAAPSPTPGQVPGVRML
jgi:hypothetical protein